VWGGERKDCEKKRGEKTEASRNKRAGGMLLKKGRIKGTGDKKSSGPLE